MGTFAETKSKIRRIIRPHKSDLDTVRAYWRQPNDVDNNPEGYLDSPATRERSEFLVKLVGRYSEPTDTVLELGCNVGRNLNYLYRSGYRSLTGIEINPEALVILRREFPEMAQWADLLEGPAESVLPMVPDIQQFDLVYTMAVLVHIHPDSEDLVFGHLARLARKTLITIEDEKTPSWRHFPRNYKDIFEAHGLICVETLKPEGLTPGYIARVFQR